MKGYQGKSWKPLMESNKLNDTDITCDQLLEKHTQAWRAAERASISDYVPVRNDTAEAI